MLPETGKGNLSDPKDQASSCNRGWAAGIETEGAVFDSISIFKLPRGCCTASRMRNHLN